MRQCFTENLKLVFEDKMSAKKEKFCNLHSVTISQVFRIGESMNQCKIRSDRGLKRSIRYTIKFYSKIILPLKNLGGHIRFFLYILQIPETRHHKIKSVKYFQKISF